MGGDPIPGPHLPLVEWFEEYKKGLPKVIFTWPSKKTREYLHGEGRKRR